MDVLNARKYSVLERKGFLNMSCVGDKKQCNRCWQHCFSSTLFDKNGFKAMKERVKARRFKIEYAEW